MEAKLTINDLHEVIRKRPFYAEWEVSEAHQVLAYTNKIYICLVTRFIASLFLFIYVFANTEAGELFRMRHLVLHFHEHKNSNPDLTVGDFMVMHYLGSQKRDKDHDQDSELPFKKHAVQCTFIETISAPPAIELEYATISSFTEKKKAVNDRFTHLEHFVDIWQPPKV